MTDKLDVENGTIYARDLDGTGSMHACSQEDEGAVRYVKFQDVMDILNAVRSGEIDNDARSIMHHVSTL
jgi:hypothetical protein